MQAVKRTPDRTINIEPEMLNFGRDSRWHRKPLFSQKRGCRKICPFLTFLGDFRNMFWGSKSNSLSILVPASPNNRGISVVSWKRNAGTAAESRRQHHTHQVSSLLVHVGFTTVFELFFLSFCDLSSRGAALLLSFLRFRKNIENATGVRPGAATDENE